MDYRGTNWGVTNFMLPFRALQRGKHSFFSRYADNWRFGGETGGAGGIFLRLVTGVIADFGLFMGTQNLHHANGHDAAAREFDRDYGDNRSVSRRFKQVLPTYFGGRPLKTWERQPNGRGADSNARANVQPMEAENTFAYEAGKGLMEEGPVNSLAVENYLLYRGRFLQDIGETGTLDQNYLDQRDTGGSVGIGSDNDLSTDFTQYLYSLNTDRYGVRRVADFKIKMGDIKTAFALQFLDPVMWSALFAFGRDYVLHGRNTSRLPMFALGRGWSYMPSLRVHFSPFGIEYFQDNYFRRGGILTNVYGMRGDNRYEKRVGGGIDVRNIPLPRKGKLGLYVQIQRQPLLSRLTSSPQARLGGNALSAAEMGRTHLAYDLGGSIQIPVWLFGSGEDPRRLFLYVRGGLKNLSWFPGTYFASGGYAQTGLGLRL